MSWIDIIQSVFIIIVLLLFALTRLPVCPHNYAVLPDTRRLDRLWHHFDTYEVIYKYSRFYIKRTNAIDGSRSFTSDSYLTREEAEAWMKHPARIVGWTDHND